VESAWNPAAGHCIHKKDNLSEGKEIQQPNAWSSFSPQLAPAAPQVAQATDNLNSCAVIASRGVPTADNQQAEAARIHVFAHLRDAHQCCRGNPEGVVAAATVAVGKGTPFVPAAHGWRQQRFCRP
jgi:hypothetical protein